MIKEIVICTIIIVSIFTLDFVTQNYTEKNIDKIIIGLEKLQEDIKNGEDKEKMQEDINNIKNK